MCIQKYNLIFLFCDVDTCVEQKCNQWEFTHIEVLSGVETTAGTTPAPNSRTYIVFKLPHDPHTMLLSIGHGYTHASLPCLPLATVHSHALSVFHGLSFYAHSVDFLHGRVYLSKHPLYSTTSAGQGNTLVLTLLSLSMAGCIYHIICWPITPAGHSDIPVLTLLILSTAGHVSQ